MTTSLLDRRFTTALEHRQPTVALRLDEAAERALRAVVEDGGAILLGELHGAAENASVIRQLLRIFGIRRLALEWEPELASLVDRFLAHGRIKLALDEDEAAAVRSWPRATPVVVSGPRVLEALALCSRDGRVTAEHFALLRALHAERALDQLILFQAGGGDWSERDRAMAERLLGEWDRRGAVLVVAGNLHTKLEPHDFGVPLGHHVAETTRAVEISLEYAQGRLAGGDDIVELLERDFDPDAAHLTAVDGGYRILLPEAHPAVVARLAATP